MFKIREYRPHIVGINEALPKNFARTIHVEEFLIDGYELVPHENITNNTGRGTILYISKTLNYKQLHIRDETGIEFSESLFVEINLRGNDKLLCCCIYRRGESDETENERLNWTVQTVADMKYSHLLMMGDFNYRGIFKI